MAIRERSCVRCGGQFQYEIARGNDRKYCSPPCQEAASEQMRLARIAIVTTECSVGGCTKPARSLKSPYCEMHYGRLRRNGTLENLPGRARARRSHGYMVSLGNKGHPLATQTQTSSIYEHRTVFYAAQGNGPFNCYHCGITVTWQNMHIDHLNEIKDDNRVENLVASCVACNIGRSRSKWLASMRLVGRKVTAFGRTIRVVDWADEFGVAANTIRLRLDRGWPAERAITEPVRARR